MIGTELGGFFRMPQLGTDRLILRRMNMSDTADIFEYGRDPEVTRHVLWAPYRSPQEAKAYLRFILRQYRGGEPSSWGIVLRDSGKLIGTIGFMTWSETHRSAEVGYSLSRAYWNRGYTTEALREVIRFGFEEMGLNRIEAQHEVDNPASGRVMEKAGMRREGVLRGRLFNKGRFVDVVLYAILRKDPRH